MARFNEIIQNKLWIKINTHQMNIFINDYKSNYSNINSF